MIPKDPVMLLSYLNTQLRDCFGSLGELCQTLDLSEEEITEKLRQIGYTYDSGQNRFRS